MNAPAQPAVIKATYVNWKTVTTRDVLQLIFEVPLAAQAETLGILGAPVPSESKWCAIALLKAPPEAPAEEPPAKDRRTWADTPPTTQAAIRCQETAFQEWVGRMTTGVPTEARAKKFVYESCSIRSRAELNTNEKAAQLWRRVDEDFRQWAGLEAEERG